MATTIQRLRQRVKQEWPRVVVALVSLYGIYYAANIILMTTHQFMALNTFDLFKGEASPVSLSSPISFGAPQITFNDYHSVKGGNQSHNERSNSYTTTASNNNYNNHSNRSSTSKPKSLMGQIRILQSATHMEMDFEGQTEAAAMYTLLVISSLSIIDNMIGIMVATRRSLKLTQVAFAIWCLRFLFRTLSLISVGFMLAFSAVFQRGSSLTPATPELPDKYDNGPNFETTGRNQSTTMYTITALEIIVALIHGWSLLVLIRDLRSQPRPRTVIVRLWTWFCGTKLGYRLGLGQYSRYHPYIHHGGAVTSGFRGADGYSVVGGGAAGGAAGGGVGGMGAGDREHGTSVWDRDIAASLGLGSGLLSSGSSIRSVVVLVSVPEMGVVPGRSRASSVSSYCSSEKI